MQSATVASFESVKKAPAPRGPLTIEETGLGADQLVRLFVKSLYTGEAPGVTGAA